MQWRLAWLLIIVPAGCGRDIQVVESDTRPIQTATDLALRAIIAPDQLVNLRVDFDDARVQAVGTAAVLVGPIREHAVLVVPVDPRMVGGLDIGDNAQVAGVVKWMPPPHWATGTAGDEPVIRAAQRSGVRVYIEADRLQAPPDPGRPAS